MADFSTLRQEAGLELMDAADEFSTTITEISRWEMGVENAPAKVMHSLRIIADYSGKKSNSKPVTLPHTQMQKHPIANTLFEGDCLDVFSKIPDASVNNF